MNRKKGRFVMKKENKHLKKWLALGTATVLGFTAVPMGLVPVYAAGESVVEDATGISKEATQNATTLILNGDWKSDLIQDATEVDCYLLDLPKDGYLTIKYIRGTLNLVSLRLFNENLQLYDENGHQEDLPFETTYYLNAGKYYIDVDSYYPEGGTYNIKAEYKEAGNTDTPYHNSFETASELSLNKREIGFLTLNDVDDYYTFTAPETGEYAFSLTADDNPHSSDSKYLTYAELYDSDRIQLNNKNGENFKLKGESSSASTQSAILEKGNTYFLNVHSCDYKSTPGKYTLLWKKADILAEDITVTPTQKTVTAGERLTLSAKITPDTTTKQTVLWTSSDTSLATVKNGKVTTKKPGLVTITAETIDGSKKTASATLSIRPKQTAAPKLKAGKGKLTASWKAQNGADGYQLQYSADKTFKKKKSIDTQKEIKRTLTLSKRTYYVRVRAYVKVNSESNTQKKLYGAWSSAKNVKVK